MTVETKTLSATLYFKQGSSDKVYSAAVEPSGTGFLVNFAYGRRGSTLQTGTKTSKPVDFDAAKKIYDKLIAEKSGKGYTPGEAGTPYQQTSREDRATGIIPQLLNPIDEAKAEKLLAEPAWYAQEKFDGKRVLIRRVADTITGINRQGLVIALPERIVAKARTLGSQQWIMDGEAVGDIYYAFDLLESACVDLRQKPYRDRNHALLEIVGKYPTKTICGAFTATTKMEKQDLYTRLKREKREGIVFKRNDAAYCPGRPASGGDQLKLKFVATASCIVAGVNRGKRSVSLELLGGDRRVNVGNVTIPANQPIPEAGDLVEVRYLYAYPGGVFFQPVLLGKRDDIAAEGCTVAQLKFKAENAGEEA